MKYKFIFSIVAMVAAVSRGAVPSVDDDFESYAEGLDFIVATNGWQASGASAYVTNALGYANSHAAYLGGEVTLTNVPGAVDPALRIWTDFRIKAVAGIRADNPETNTTSFLSYIGTNGALYIAHPAGWLICTNDIWGNAVEPLTNGAYVRVSIFQDYGTSTQAVFVNDQLVAQDLSFASSVENYHELAIRNSDESCLLDTVWIHTNVSGLVANRNTDAESLSDAEELQRYGYARRTLYVTAAETNLVPLYSTIVGAVSAWRPRDTVCVLAGDYSAEQVVLASNVVFEGAAFAVDTLTIAAGASVTLTQSVVCGTLWVTGQVAVAGGASLTSTAVYVEGSFAMSTGGTFVATSLDIGASGVASFSNVHFIVSGAGADMYGTFSLSTGWDTTLVSQELPFEDSFDLYAVDTAVPTLRFRGWDATDSSVVIQDGTAHAGNAVWLPDGTVLSNSISSSATKIWTDAYAQMMPGEVPASIPDTADSGFLAYVNSDGNLVVATQGGGWVVCSNQLDNVPAPDIASNAFTRITICLDLGVTPNQFAVFVEGRLLAQGLNSPANLSHYASLVTDNQNGGGYNAYLDDVLITTNLPSGLLTYDLDHDGMPDAYEIHHYGLTTLMPRGSIYRVR